MIREYLVKGTAMPLYSIGELASAIGRDAFTVREWERKGIIPRASMLSPKGGRLYLRAEIEALVQIMREEDPRAGVALSKTKLKDRAFTEWTEIRIRMGLVEQKA